VKITLVDLSAATDAWTPGGVWFLGRGEYQIDIPDAAFATATVEVTLSGEATGLHVICEPMAVAYVPADLQTIKTQAVACAAGVTVNANVGTTQPVGFTGTGASALVKGDAVDLGGTAAASALNAATPALSSAGVTAVQSGLATSAGQTTINNNVLSVATIVTAIQTVLSGITSLAQWLGLLAGKQAGNSTARTELRATGAGSGTFDETTDSLEAVADASGGGSGSDPLTNASDGYASGEIGYEMHELYRKGFGDHKIDRTTSPGWTEVWFDPGTDIEVLRLRLLDIAGNPIKQATTIVAQEVR
jgi:hypothetical protein